MKSIADMIKSKLDELGDDSKVVEGSLTIASEGDEALEDAAASLAKAIKRDDAKGIAKAFKMMAQICSHSYEDEEEDDLEDED